MNFPKYLAHPTEPGKDRWAVSGFDAKGNWNGTIYGESHGFSREEALQKALSCCNRSNQKK
jgi:hypothetical protein